MGGAFKPLIPTCVSRGDDQSSKQQQTTTTGLTTEADDNNMEKTLAGEDKNAYNFSSSADGDSGGTLIEGPDW